MDKIQECVNFKYKISNNDINKRFEVPMRTLQNWNKDKELQNWRGKLLCDLKMFYYLEKITKEKIKKLFRENELNAIKASLISTLVTEEFYSTRELFSYHFKDTCLYEPMLIDQFTDNQNLEVFCNAVSSKLIELSAFEKYVLLQICYMQ